MTSHRVETVHQELLNKLLTDSGLECFRSPLVSSEESISSKSPEEQGPAEVEAEPLPEEEPEEEQKLVEEEEAPDLLPEVFPGPSLRHMISDRTRALEKENRIHVLPEEFKTEIDPLAIPKILSTPQQKYIDILAELVGCKRYKSSLAEFWFLDTLANLLRRAQEDELDRPTQAILILWFCEWMKEMQQFDAADRKRMMRRFQDNMLEATRYIVDMEEMPTPEMAGVYYKSRDFINAATSVYDSSAKLLAKNTAAPKSTVPESKTKVHFASTFECCIRDLAKIIHYIFDLFSTDYQYNLVRSVFTFSPDYSLIDGPHQIQNPKKMYAPVKVKPKKVVEKSPRRDSKTPKGPKKKEPAINEEYLAFLEANGDYLHRHNLVARIIHQQLALKYSLVELEVPYYRYVPDPVLENGNITLYWDRSIITDRTIVANKPDIVVVDRLERRAMIVDITVPHEENLVKAEKDKQIKYLDLPREVVGMWNKKAAAERMIHEQEEYDMEQWDLKSHILPLGRAVTEEFFDKYWPPPPPPHVGEPVPDTAKGKAKKGKK